MVGSQDITCGPLIIGMVVGSVHVCARISTTCSGTCLYGWFALTQGADADETTPQYTIYRLRIESACILVNENGLEEVCGEVFWRLEVCWENESVLRS